MNGGSLPSFRVALGMCRPRVHSAFLSGFVSLCFSSLLVDVCGSVDLFHLTVEVSDCGMIKRL